MTIRKPAKKRKTTTRKRVVKPKVISVASGENAIESTNNIIDSEHEDTQESVNMIKNDEQTYKNDEQTMGLESQSDIINNKPKRQKYGGRTKGVKNKKNELAQTFKKIGFNYDKELAICLTSSSLTDKDRLDALIKLAPFIYNKPTIEVNTTSTEDKTVRIIVETSMPNALDITRRHELEAMLGERTTIDVTPDE